jgi:hypothetical protein
MLLLYSIFTSARFAIRTRAAKALALRPRTSTVTLAPFRARLQAWSKAISPPPATSTVFPAGEAISFQE